MFQWLVIGIVTLLVVMWVAYQLHRIRKEVRALRLRSDTGIARVNRYLQEMRSTLGKD